MKVLALIERRIDKLLGAHESHVTVDWADVWNCPFTGKLMVEPMLASDNITYEKVEIERWIREHKTCLVSPVTGAKMSEKLNINRAVQSLTEAFRENHQIPLETRSLCTNPTLSQDLVLFRLLLSFRWLTNSKIESFDQNKLAKPFLSMASLPFSWWPMIDCKILFIKSAWKASPTWKMWIYEIFAAALQQNIEKIKHDASYFYTQTLIQNTYDRKTDQIFKALTTYASYRQSETQDMPKIDEYKKAYYNEYLKFWGEKPPEPVPLPVVRRSVSPHPYHPTEPRGTYYYDAWPPR